MLVNCKPGCSGKKITTEAELDVEQDEAICTFCYEAIPVSKFVKTTLKQQGKILNQNNKKSFQFNCLSCKKKVQTKLEGKKPVGIDCTSSNCEFNISKFILIAMQNVSSENSKESKLEEVTQSQE